MNNFKIALAAILGGVIVLIGGCAAFTGFTSPEAGEISVIRNGGPLDNREIRGIIQPGSGIQWIGMMSKAHPYPAQQRFYTITADGDGDRKGADVVQTPTSDGVEVGLEGRSTSRSTRARRRSSGSTRSSAPGPSTASTAAATTRGRAMRAGRRSSTRSSGR